MAYKKQKGALAMKMSGKGGALPMKSPMKNYKNPQDYKVFNMGNKPTPMEMHGKHDGPKMYDSPTDMKETGKTATYMKSSGFKMRDGSPMKRNFGVGEAPSPMKRTGEYTDIIDKETGEVLKTERNVSGFDDSRLGLRKGHTKGDEFYESQQKQLQRTQPDHEDSTGRVSGDEATGKMKGREVIKKRRLTGVDLMEEKKRNLINEYKQKNIEVDWDDPRFKEIKAEYNQYKEDNPDTWEQDAAIYKKRTGQDYDSTKIPQSTSGDPEMDNYEDHPSFDKAMEAEKGTGEYASKDFDIREFTNTKGETKDMYDPAKTEGGYRYHDDDIQRYDFPEEIKTTKLEKLKAEEEEDTKPPREI